MDALNKIKVGDNDYYYIKIKINEVIYKKLIGKLEIDEITLNEEIKKFKEELADNEKKIREKNIIELLESLQSKYGFSPEEEIVKISKELDIPGTDIYGVATFYSIFKLEKPSEFIIKVCDGTACHVRGSNEILKTIREELKIGDNNISENNKFSLEIVRCLGLCASAPLMVINDKLYPKLDSQKVKEILRELYTKND